jgi:FkbM family methyltransferase
MIDFFYGVGVTYINITKVVLERCTYGNHVFIPASDLVRESLFPDPARGTAKAILVFRGDPEERFCTGFDGSTTVDLRLTPEEVEETAHLRNCVPALELTIDEKLRQVHAELQFVGGSLEEEWTEQRLVAGYLNRNSNVLEIGASVGRNSLIISTLLEDDRSFVALECEPSALESLRTNRDTNNRKFSIEPSALSYRKLAQRCGDTVPVDEVPPGYDAVQTIGYEELQTKYSVTFDSLVVDCGGAIYYVLQDNPGILRDISTIILQSDYRSTEHKIWVDQLLCDSGFRRIYSEPLLGPEWLPAPDECQKSYYEVWKKTTE